MIYLTAQPDELYFVWQSHVQLENFRSLGIPMKDVHILVGIKQGLTPNVKWEELSNKYLCNIYYIQDTRVSTNYPGSIRPNLIAQFLEFKPEFCNEYIFYSDSDVIFRQIPLFEGMMDGRWHISKTPGYTSLAYVQSKKSQTLTADMLNFVGITYEQATKAEVNVGGVQYFIPNTTAQFWKTLEYKMELMWTEYHNNIATYKKEVYDNRLYPDYFHTGRDIPTYIDWIHNKDHPDRYDFQIWCTDLFCIYWELVRLDIEVYANPLLNFSWPMNSQDEYESCDIFHNSGILPINKEWFYKQNYKEIEPFGDMSIQDLGWIKFDNGILVKGAQRNYIEIIERIGNQTKELLITTIWKDLVEDHVKHTIPENHLDQLMQSNRNIVFDENVSIKNDPKVSCVMTTYGRHTIVNRSIHLWLLQDYPNKELIIYNTAEVPLVLHESFLDKNIRIINNGQDLETFQSYSSIGPIRRDAVKFASGEYYICWDDDDFYFPWHISQGMEYLQANPNMKAYMPEKSLFTQDGGKTFSLESNSMEAACIVEIGEIRRYGFDSNSNGGEHLTWRQGMVQDGTLDQHVKVTPFESYMYTWGESISPRKQSAHINDPNNFENHKAANTDFGTTPLKYSKRVRDSISKWYFNMSIYIKDVRQFKRIYDYI